MHVDLYQRVREGGTCDYKREVKLYQEGIDLAVMQRSPEEQMIRSILCCLTACRSSPVNRLSYR